MHERRPPRGAACCRDCLCCLLTRARPLAGRVQAVEMAQEGATLQNYNNELVTCIEDLRSKREEVNKSIAADEEEKA